MKEAFQDFCFPCVYAFANPFCVSRVGSQFVAIAKVGTAHCCRSAATAATTASPPFCLEAHWKLYSQTALNHSQIIISFSPSRHQRDLVTSHLVVLPAVAFACLTLSGFFWRRHWFPGFRFWGTQIQLHTCNKIGVQESPGPEGPKDSPVDLWVHWFEHTWQSIWYEDQPVVYLYIGGAL